MAAIAMCVAASSCGYLIVSFVAASKLAREGYRAAARGDHEGTIANLSSALQGNLFRNQRAIVYLNRGGAYIHKRKPDEAIRGFTEALRLNSTLMDAYTSRGFAYQQKHDFDKALIDLNEAIKRDPNSGQAFHTRSLIFFERGQLDLALADLNEAVRCWPEGVEPVVARGLVYLRKGDLEGALVDFDAAIMMDPRNAHAFFQRAIVYERIGDARKSGRDREEAKRLMGFDLRSVVDQIAAKSNSIQPTMSLDAKPLKVSPLPQVGTPKSFAAGKTYDQVVSEAELALAIKDLDRAIVLINEALAMDITPLEASASVMQRGNAYFEKNQFDKATRDYDEAIRLNAKNATAYVGRALVLQRIGKRTEAIKQCDAAIEINHREWLAYYTRADLLRAEGDLPAALGDMNEALVLNPTYAEGYASRAAIYLRDDDPENAITNCDRAIELDPVSVWAHVNRAAAHARKNGYAEAKKDFESATRNLKTDDITGLNSIAWFRATCPLAELRDGRRAIKEATRACEITAWKWFPSIDTLATAYAEDGRFADAVRFEKRALAMNPGRADRARMEKRLALFENHEAFRD